MCSGKHLNQKTTFFRANNHAHDTYDKLGTKNKSKHVQDVCCSFWDILSQRVANKHSLTDKYLCFSIKPLDLD